MTHTNSPILTRNHNTYTHTSTKEENGKNNDYKRNDFECDLERTNTLKP